MMREKRDKNRNTAENCISVTITDIFVIVRSICEVDWELILYSHSILQHAPSYGDSQWVLSVKQENRLTPELTVDPTRSIDVNSICHRFNYRKKLSLAFYKSYPLSLERKILYQQILQQPQP